MATTLEELKPIIDLMTLQEERLVKKIDGIHVEVKEANNELKKINGSTMINKSEIEKIKSTCEVRGNSCLKKLNDLTVSINVIKWANIIMKRPKLLLLFFILTIFIVQIITLEAVEKRWIGELLKFIKP